MLISPSTLLNSHTDIVNMFIMQNGCLINIFISIHEKIDDIHIGQLTSMM